MLRSSRLLALVAFFGASASFLSCGVKGPPLPPINTNPEKSEPAPKPSPVTVTPGGNR